MNRLRAGAWREAARAYGRMGTMEQDPDDSFEISPGVRRAVGDVVIQATRVELQLIQVARNIEQESWDWARGLWGISGAARRTVKELLHRQRPVPDRDQLQALYDRADDLLDQRHRVAHNLVVPVFTTDGNFQGHHMMSAKHDELRLVAEEDLARLAAKLEQLADDLRSFRPVCTRPES